MSGCDDCTRYSGSSRVVNGHSDRNRYVCHCSRKNRLVTPLCSAVFIKHRIGTLPGTYRLFIIITDIAQLVGSLPFWDFAMRRGIAPVRSWALCSITQ